MRRLNQLDHDLVDILAEYEGQLSYENTPFVPDDGNRERILSRLRDVSRDVSLTRSTFSDEQYKVLFGHWDELLELAEARLIDDTGYPYRFVRPIVGRINSLVNFSHQDPDTRVSGVEEVLSATPRVMDAVLQLLANVPLSRRESALEMLESALVLADGLPARMARAFSGITESRLARLNELAWSMRHSVSETLTKARTLSDPSGSSVNYGLPYKDELKLIYGIDIDELLAMHREEVEVCSQELFRVAKSIDPRRDPFAILNEDLGPYESPEAMFKDAEWMVPFSREKALEYITLPTGEVCEVWETPDHLKETYPWGGYWGGNTLKGELNGAVFLNKANYRAVTKGWVELNAVHECYPGHHAHAVKTAAANMPLTFKWSSLLARSSPHTEGIAMRTETLQKHIWNDAFPLFVAYRRLHTAARIWCDLEMFHFRRGREAAVDVYMKYLKFSRVSAVGQAKSQELTPGYFTIYYYGLKALERLQQQCGWNDKDFTEMIFSAGKTSLSTVSRLIALSPADRHSLLSAFDTRQPTREICF